MYNTNRVIIKLMVIGTIKFDFIVFRNFFYSFIHSFVLSLFLPLFHMISFLIPFFFILPTPFLKIDTDGLCQFHCGE